ncbi:MAG: aldo/keto reductase [Actinomycetes bacterium]
MARHSERVSIKGTALEVTRLGLGTAPLGGLFTSVDEQDSDDLIVAAFDHGINFFDTAPQYGHGVAEQRLGRILQRVGKPFVLETKVGRVLNPTNQADKAWFADADPHLEPIFDFSADGVKRSIEDSLRRLGVDHIDIALLHDAEDHLPQAIEEAYPVLDSLRSQGVIKAVGMGLNLCQPSVTIMKNTDLNVALIAGRYTLLDQEGQEELFPLALKKNVSILAAGVFNSGVLANPVAGAKYNYVDASDEVIKRAQEIGKFLRERNIPLTAAALQFPLRHPAVTAVLTGSRNRAELESNIKDFDVTIPDSIWAELEASGLVAKLKVS